MILLIYVYLLIAIDAVFCKEHIIYESENKDVKVINTNEDYTIIRCEHLYNGLMNFTLPTRKLVVKNDIRFQTCYIPDNFQISKFMEDLGVEVNKLTFHLVSALKKHNLVGLENLQYLTISQRFDEWDKDLLQNLTNLELLRIEECKFVALPINFFRYTRKLKTLEILDSKVEKLGKELFHGLSNLSHLKLKIYLALSIDDGFTFEDLTSLKLLNISLYTLNILPPASFRNFINLENLIVHCNDYRYTDKEIILPNKLFVNIKSLSLESVGSKELPKHIFEHNFGMIHKLSISGYEGDTLSDQIFKNTPNITELRITQNNIKSLPYYIFENLNKLEVLDLSCNKFYNLSL